MKTTHDLTPTVRSANVAADYCRKLKSGISRLRATLRTQYGQAFPEHQLSIERALADAEESAWSTPFPSLFFPVLARIRITEVSTLPPAPPSTH